MALELTDTAAARVQAQLTARGHGAGLRVGVKTTGCSGYAYIVDFADEIHKSDEVFQSRGVQLVVDRESLELIDGTVIDFTQQGLSESFTFNNPKVTGSCGCGESFSVA